MPRPAPALRRACHLVLLALAIVGCASNEGPSPIPPTALPSTPPSAASTPSAPAAPTAAAPPTAVPSPSPPTQTDTAWGRIWDALPEDFPIPPAAVETEADEPVSGAFDLPMPADVAAIGLQTALELANLSTEWKSGPDEAGGYVIESVRPESLECRVEATIVPLGDLTRLTIRYGAACPFD